MPYFSIQTNLSVPEKEAFLQEASAFAADLLGKPESYVMVALQDETAMAFAGGTQPASYVLLASIGLDSTQCSDYCARVCNFIQTKLNVPPNRIYIDFRNIERSMFGWNNNTF